MVRAVLAVVAIVTIFGASISAASDFGIDPAVTVVSEASLSLPTSAERAAAANERDIITVAPAAEREDARTNDADAQEIEQAATPDAETASTGQLESDVAELETGANDAAFDVPGAGAVDTLSIKGLGDASGQNELDGPSEEVLALVAKVEEKDRQILVLSEQLAYLRQAQLSDQLSGDGEVADTSALATKTRLTREENAAAMDLWRAGYILGGGQNLSAFENTILPCESGSQPNPDTAVGRTDDWGRAQINRPVWKNRFESLTGAEFEVGILNPTLNGYMAAHVEQEQGLSAWTCWRKR